jgi:hypothetical protein
VTVERLHDLVASSRRDLRAAGKADCMMEIHGGSVRYFSD